MVKGPSDSLLNKMWRQAVLTYWNYTDPVAQHYDPTGESLQCHHIVFRRHYLLRWDVQNGVPLTTESHRAAHQYIDVRRKIEDLVNMDYLTEMSRWTKKDYLLRHNMSDAEFRQEKKRELELIIRRAA